MSLLSYSFLILYLTSMLNLCFIFLFFIAAISIATYIRLNNITKEIKDIRNILNSPNRKGESLCETKPTPPPFIREKFSIPEPAYIEPSQENEPILHPQEEKREKKGKSNLEKLIGENLFSKIGILALIIGIGFFVKYAIDNNWINETGRTILGLSIGFAVWFLAYRLRKNYHSFSSVLAGGGFAICFVTLTIAHQYYNLLSWSVTFSSLIALSIILTFMALKENRRELAIIAVLGCYVAPFLIITSNDSIITLLSYVALLSILQFIISLKRKWWELPMICTILSWVIVGISVFRPVSDSAPLWFIAFISLFFTLFSFPITACQDNKRSAMFFLNLLVMILNPFAYIILALAYIGNLLPFSLFKGFFPMYVAIVNVAIWWHLSRQTTDSLPADTAKWLAIIFAGMFMPIQFSSLSFIILGFAVYALLLMISFLKTGRKYLMNTSILISAIAIAWIIFEFSFELTNTTLLLLGIIFSLMALLSFFFSSRFHAYKKNFSRRFFGVMINVGAAFLSCAIYNYSELYFPSLLDYPLFLFISASLFSISLFAPLTALTYIWHPLLAILSLAAVSLTGNYSVSGGIWFYWISVILLAFSIINYARRTISNGSLLHRSSTGQWIYFSIISTIFLNIIILAAIDQAGVKNFFSAGISIGLIISATLLMIFGMYWKKLVLRVESLLFFVFLLIKLGVYDIWKLPVVGRIIVLIMLGCVLLSISFLYQKFKSIIFHSDSPSIENQSITKK